jgi:hypothetical protein
LQPVNGDQGDAKDEKGGASVNRQEIEKQIIREYHERQLEMMVWRGRLEMALWQVYLLLLEGEARERLREVQS